MLYFTLGYYMTLLFAGINDICIIVMFKKTE